MSRLDELITQLCPNGVSYKRLGDIGIFYSGLNGKSKGDFKNGNATFVTYMNVFSNIELKTDITDKVYISENERQNTVQYGDIIFTGSSETPDECGMSSVLTTVIEEKLYLNSFCFGYRLNNPNILLPGFSKYLFRSNALRRQIIKTASGVTRFNVSKKKMESVKLPVPPLEVQREIVRVLDNFTFLTAELTAELTARKKQYESYRKKLLAVDAYIKKCQLGDIVSIYRGKRVVRGELSQTEGYPVYQNSLIPLGYYDKANTEAHKTFVISAGAAGEIGYSKHPFWAADDCLYFECKKEISEKYLYYFLMDNITYIKSQVRRSSVPRLSKDVIAKMVISLPSIEIQNRVISILDNFETLCNDITIGLPAEIAARQKQYEYYRDKLLTFKELNE